MQRHESCFKLNHRMLMRMCVQQSRGVGEALHVSGWRCSSLQWPEPMVNAAYVHVDPCRFRLDLIGSDAER
jgi:hypothetical protein